MKKTPPNHLKATNFYKLCKPNHDYIVSPIIWNIEEDTQKYHYWQISIALVDCNKANSKVKIDDVKTMKITDELANRSPIPEGYCGAWWTISGQEGTTKPIVTLLKFVTTGKSLSSSNYTTVLTQAILDALTQYNKRIKDGGQLDKDNLFTNNVAVTMELLISSTKRGEFPWRVFPMAYHVYEDHSKKIVYPAYLMRKLDGQMLVVVQHPKLPSREVKYKNIKANLTIDAYSRSRDAFGAEDHILLEIYPVLKHYPGLHVVGELKNKGQSLQKTSGAARKEDGIIKLRFNIFDAFYLDQTLDYEERRVILGELHEALQPDDLDEPGEEKFCYVMESVLVKNETEMKKLYKSYIDDGDEGAMIYNTDGLYRYGLNKEIRTYEAQKIKPRQDSEWPVIGFLDGEGKEKGLIMWKCAENETGVFERTGTIPALEDRKTFTVSPNQSEELRTYIYKKVSENGFFKKHLYGQLLTVTFHVLTDDQLPQQPRAIRFRDPKIEALIMEGYTV